MLGFSSFLRRQRFFNTKTLRIVLFEFTFAVLDDPLEQLVVLVLTFDVLKFLNSYFFFLWKCGILIN
jgi:hypothetical protein